MDILFDKEVTIKKPHRCFACGRKFEPPTKMRCQTHTYDGIQTVYSCATCNSLMDQFRDLFYDECEMIYPEFCVSELLRENGVLTPEEFLIKLTREGCHNEKI
jgi:DNA-directed RNA polymerase subunit RPC12/RpoP